MEVFLYNSTVCRLCGEENDNGTLLYSSEENSQNLSEIINTYLPIKVSDDGQLPRTICPGCTIQIEATVEFITLIINGQKIIRELHQREKEYKKTLFNNAVASEPEIITENIVYEINTSDGVYQVEHPIALQVAGLEKPKRKRGRPPKKPKSPEELAQEAAARQQVEEAKVSQKEEELQGKRRRKTPTRFKEAVQGKELERIFKEEGVTDGDESDAEAKPDADKPPVSKEPEVIGHMEASGELVVVVKGKGRGRPKGRMRPTREQCAICGMEFSCVGRYMSHVAAHGPVQYRCGCGQTFPTRLMFTTHQRTAAHEGQTVIPCDTQNPENPQTSPIKTEQPPEPSEELPSVEKLVSNVQDTTLPAAVPDADTTENVEKPDEKPEVAPETTPPETEVETDTVVLGPSGKPKLKCPQCDKMFSNKQSRSLHIKAVHEGAKPYVCVECGATFAYPRSLALHAHSHRRAQPTKGFACDLCGKVLNHPSSVVYHKEAEHTGQRYVCGKCGKLFKHKQLLQRHQLVHSQARPYSCKICSTSFKTKANLLNHALLHSGVKRFACELCKHRFAHKTSLTLHMRWHSGLKPYTCKTCGKSFSQKGNLSEHERIHTGEKPYQCAQCPRRFTTSSQHRLHARRHQADTERPHVCNHCGKRFVCRSSWLAHMRRETRAAGGAARHRCAVCARGFAERGALLKHQRRHTGERPFRCPLCPRAFADCSNLNKHKKVPHPPTVMAGAPGWSPEAPVRGPSPTAPTSTSTRRYHTHRPSWLAHLGGALRHRCAVCARGFAERGALLKHQRRHTGERPFRCPLCPRAFADCSNLNKHKKVPHPPTVMAGAPGWSPEAPVRGPSPTAPTSTSTRRYHTHRPSWLAHLGGALRHRCAVCARGFAERGALLKHQRRHTGERPFRCPLCPRAFADCSNLNKHKKVPHPPTVMAGAPGWSPEAPVRGVRARVRGARRAAQAPAPPHRRAPLPLPALPQGLRRLLQPQQAQEALRHRCAVCARGFAERGALLKHQRRHTGERPFRCPLCPRAFADCSNLNKHKKVPHPPTVMAGAPGWSPEAPVRGPSPTAPTSTSTRRYHTHRPSWLAHLGGALRHRCAVCARGFAERGALLKHQRRHTGERPFRCPLCPRAFADCSNLNKHKKVPHPPTVMAGAPGWSPEAPVRGVRARVRGARRAAQAPAPPHRRAPLPLPALPQGLRRLLQPQQAQEGPSPTAPTSTSTRRYHTHRPSWLAHLGGALRHRCAVCARGFAERGALLKHQRRHTGERPFRCPLCPRAFADCSNLNKHKKVPHPPTVMAGAPGWSPEAPVRGVRARVRGARRAAQAPAPPHRRAPLPLPALPQGLRRLLQPQQAQEALRHRCAVCARGFAERGALLKHQRRHTGERPFRCPLCPRAFADCSNLNKHKKVPHPPTVMAGAPGWSPEAPVRGPSPTAPTSTSTRRYHTHRPSWLAHLGGALRHRCAVCARGFAERGALLKHQRRHTGERPFRCPLCPRAFADCSNLNKHKKVPHPPTVMAGAPGWSPEAPVRGVRARVRGARRAAQAPAPPHRRAPLPLPALPQGLRRLLQPQQAQEALRHRCAVCARGFAERGALLKHQRRHTGERPFRCPLCPRAFADCSNLNKHKKVPHPPTVMAGAPGWSPEAPVRGPSPTAPTSTSTRRYHTHRPSWLAHLGGALRHRCAVCARGFAERGALLKHQRRHTGERPFRCPLCPRAFADCSNLNKHKKQVHKQVSLLVDKNLPVPAAAAPASPQDERVIYVAYDVDSGPTAFHIVESDQMTTIENDTVLKDTLYSGSSLLRRPELPEPEPVEQMEQVEHVLEEMEPVVLEESEHMPVTDEQGNPLHFTMQDGTRLAITSADGKSLQVITQDGQTIPVEINGFADEEEIENPDTIVHQLNLQKTVDTDGASHVAHYFTIV
ncbi:zinc finger protein Xfin-like [Cydia fagiglandana]|uniref:zinc finger protein Xfin-like n=1 Tax=Cydia fagiglandana TaxID=1458189 RepID=UPI002FEE2F4F